MENKITQRIAELEREINELIKVNEIYKERYGKEIEPNHTNKDILGIKQAELSTLNFALQEFEKMIDEMQNEIRIKSDARGDLEELKSKLGRTQ